MARALVDRFSYVAMFLADRGDGALEDDELRTLLSALQEVARAYGVPADEARRIGLGAAQRFLADRENRTRDELAALLLAEVDAVAQDHPDLLPRLYRDLVQISAADGHTEHGESRFLAVLRGRWGLA